MFILYSINKDYKNQHILITFYNFILTVIYLPRILFCVFHIKFPAAVIYLKTIIIHISTFPLIPLNAFSRYELLIMVRQRQIIGNQPVDLSPSIPKLGIENPQCHQHRGFLFSCMDYSLLLACCHYSICRNKMQYAFSKKFKAIQAASAPRATWVANQEVDFLFLVFLLSFLLLLFLMHLQILNHYLTKISKNSPTS